MQRGDPKPLASFGPGVSVTTAASGLFYCRQELIEFHTGRFLSLTIQRRKVLHGCNLAEISSHLQQGFRGLSALELIGLCQQYMRRQGNMLGKGQHLPVDFRELAANVDNHEESAKTLSNLEIVRHQISPVVTFSIGYTGEAVAGEIDETSIVAQAEEINELRSARRLAGARELAPIDDHIDRAGLSAIRSTGKGNLSSRIRDELRSCVGALDKLSFWVLRHWGAPRVLCV